MNANDPMVAPSGHTAAGRVLVCDAEASNGMVLFGDPRNVLAKRTDQLRIPLRSAQRSKRAVGLEERGDLPSDRLT